MKYTEIVHIHNMTSLEMRLKESRVWDANSKKVPEEDAWQKHRVPPKIIPADEIGSCELSHNDGDLSLILDYHIGDGEGVVFNYNNSAAHKMLRYNTDDIFKLAEEYDRDMDFASVKNADPCGGEIFVTYGFRGIEGDAFPRKKVDLLVYRVPITKNIEFQRVEDHPSSQIDGFHVAINASGHIEATWDHVTLRTRGVALSVKHQAWPSGKHASVGRSIIETNLWSDNDPSAGCEWNPAKAIFPRRYTAAGLTFKITTTLLDKQGHSRNITHEFRTIEKGGR